MGGDGVTVAMVGAGRVIVVGDDGMYRIRAVAGR